MCPIVNVSVEKLAVKPVPKFIVLAATTGEYVPNDTPLFATVNATTSELRIPVFDTVN